MGQSEWDDKMLGKGIAAEETAEKNEEIIENCL